MIGKAKSRNNKIELIFGVVHKRHLHFLCVFWKYKNGWITPTVFVLYLQNYIYKTKLSNCRSCISTLRSSPRPISNSQLHTLLHFHLCPIYLVVFKGSYFFRMGYLILRGASRLDAFSVYPFQTWLPGHALGRTTGTPAVRPPRSSRTKGSSSQISYAHAG